MLIDLLTHSDGISAGHYDGQAGFAFLLMLWPFALVIWSGGVGLALAVEAAWLAVLFSVAWLIDGPLSPLFESSHSAWIAVGALLIPVFVGLSRFETKVGSRRLTEVSDKD